MLLLSLINLAIATGAGQSSLDEPLGNRELQGNCTTPLDCGGDGTDNFCGTDGRCKPYNCESVYQYGPVRLTGNENGSGPALSCSAAVGSTLTGAQVYSTIYACTRTNSSAAGTYGLLFDQVCSAIVSGNKIFTCYQMSSTFNYSAYIADTAGTSGFECPGVEQTTPLYYYNGRLAYERNIVNESGGSPSSMNTIIFINANPNSTEAFEESFARSTMSSLLLNIDTPAPSPGQGRTPAPSPPSLGPVLTSYGTRLEALVSLIVASSALLA